MPVSSPVFRNGIMEGLALIHDYAREHVVTCLLPAFFIAGGLAVFLKKESVMRYLGPKTRKVVAYAVASVSGSVLAVCSCTVLPLFAGIYRMGAGLGPATAFLYAGPAINVLAIVLTARVLGMEMGIARAVGAVIFSVVIGLLMHLIYRNEEKQRVSRIAATPVTKEDRPLWKTVIIFTSMVGVLVFANWGLSRETSGLWYTVWSYKWLLTAICAIAVALSAWRWLGVKLWKLLIAAMVTAGAAALGPGHLVVFAVAAAGFAVSLGTSRGEGKVWVEETWGFAKLILPLLFIGVLIAGALLGRPGNEGWIPSHWVNTAVGGNSAIANLLASIAGAFMYFATLTEVPIVQGLLGSGMGKGPALALLLAGPALSLPNMLVIRTVLGTGKTVTFVGLVVIMATVSGILFGLIT
jgi:uncharacterized membrane protein YraQ (UPF0718 family)